MATLVIAAIPSRFTGGSISSEWERSKEWRGSSACTGVWCGKRWPTRYQKNEGQSRGRGRSWATVRAYERYRKLKTGLTHRETFVPQSYTWGHEGQVDWYGMVAELGGEKQKVQIFCLRSVASAGAFHRAYPHASQQAFLEAHELAFHYFVGVFHLLRYDNLTSAVQRILRGSQREATARFVAFRSHWSYAAEFCNPARGNEKAESKEKADSSGGII
jgi:transposase